jgi:uncharacterized protein (TIGR03492 family)
MKILCLSNGHGEDVIAGKILQELQKQEENLKLFALPLVGEGRVYQKLNIPIIGDVKTMPSGGFIYMDSKEMVKDIQGGLLNLTKLQYKAIKDWANTGGSILAVGDIVPLLFAYLSGVNYAFIGTAKSEYYVRDENGILPRKNWRDRLESLGGSIYLPWERFLMGTRRCKAVFPRDELTTKILHEYYIRAVYLGNPMMDDLQFDHANYDIETEKNRPLTITILPGSRPPEAYRNWSQILLSLQEIIKIFPQVKLIFLAAIASGLELLELQKILTDFSWQKSENQQILSDNQAKEYQQANARLIISQNAYSECLNLGDFAIAMAGTATEQFIGLGKPAIAIPGTGPQYNYIFAEAQSRLLGISLILVNKPEEVAGQIKALLADPDRLQMINKNGKKRMGEIGAAQRIAACLLERFAEF